MRPPLFSKPAGVFLQLLGLIAILVAIAVFASGGRGGGVVATLVGVGFLWLGRQTHPREDRPRPPSGNEWG